MATLKQTAMAYVPPQTANVAELKQFSVDVEIKTHKGNKDGEEFTYDYIEVADKHYRVPKSVIWQIKLLLTKMPKLKNVSVAKDGTGMNTKYQVIPILDAPSN